MLDMPRVKSTDLAVVRRFTGGGTVVVDPDTLMVSFVFGAAAAPEVPCFPAPLMAWSEHFYRGVFHDTATSDFRLRENGVPNRSFIIALFSRLALTPFCRLCVW